MTWASGRHPKHRWSASPADRGVGPIALSWVQGLRILRTDTAKDSR